MSKQQNYGSRFLYSEDLLIDGKFLSPVVEISEVHQPGTLQSADKRSIDKWTIGFRGKQNLLVLCKTNASIIHFLTGCEPGEKWIGHCVTLEVREVSAFGAQTLAIRVIPPKGTVLRKSLIDRLGKKAEFKGVPSE